MKQAGWRVDPRGKGKSTPRKQQQALARIQAAVKKIKHPNPAQGFFNAWVVVAITV